MNNIKLAVISAIALLAAAAIFGGSLTYAATSIEEVEKPKTVSVYNDEANNQDGLTAADILSPNSSKPESSSASSAPASSVASSSEISSVPSSAPSSAPSSIPSSAPSSKPSSQPSSTPSSKPSSVPSSAPSSKPSSEPSSAPSSAPSSEPPSSENTELSEPIVPPPSDGTVDEWLVDKIAGAVQREIVGVNTAPRADSYEAYKAQAVACHSYMKYHQKADGSFPTMSYTTPHQKTTELVRSVVNQLIYYNGSVINASYHASSGGGTQAAEFVWGNKIPYLVGVASTYDDSYANCIISADSLANSLASAGIITSGDPSTWFDLNSATYTDGGFINTIPICGQNVKGRTLRESIIGGTKLRSCKITGISFDGTNFSITTNGFGHGVGLSQIGALGYAANEGWNYVQILTHYYQGTTVQ